MKGAHMRGAQSTELVSLYIGYWTLNNYYYYYYDTCIHHSNVCDIDRNACVLLFNLYMQCHYIAFILILLKYYTSSSYIFRGYILQ